MFTSMNVILFCTIFCISCFTEMKANRLKLGVFLDFDFTYLNGTEMFGDQFEIVIVNQNVTPYNSLNDLTNDVIWYRKLELSAMIGDYSYLGSILADQLNIPYYVLNLDQNSAQKRNMFEVDFSDNVITDAYKDMINYNSYQTILVLADSYQRSNVFRKMFTGRLLNSYTLKSTNDTNLNENLINTRGIDGAHAFILAFEDKNQFMIETIFNKALFMDMMNSLNLWLIAGTNNDPRYLLPFARNVANINTFAVTNTTINNSSSLRQAILRDCVMHLWTAYNSGGSNSLINKVKTTNIIGYTGNFAFNNNGKRINFTLNVMAPRNSSNVLIKIGEWIQNRTPYPYFSTYNGALLRDINLRVGVFVKPPYFSYKSNGQIYGFTNDVFVILSKLLKFKFTYVMIPDNSIGTFNNITNNWSGAMNMLQNKMIDICGIPAATNNQRQSTTFSTYSNFVLRSGYNMLISSTIPDEWDFIKFLTPFSWFIWFFIIIVGLLMTFILWIIDKISPKDVNESNYTFAQAGLAVFESFVMSKTPENPPRKASSRLFFFILWLTSLLIVVFYSATLTGYFVKSSSVLQFTDLQTLYDNGVPNGYKWIFRNDSESASNLLESGGYYANLVTYAQKNWPNSMYIYGDDFAVINMLSNNGKTVLINDGLQNDYMQHAESLNCLVKTFGNYEINVSLLFYMRNDLPQIGLLKQEIQKLVDSQFIGNLQEKYFKTGICTTEHIQSVKVSTSLSFKSFVGIFILLGIGLVIASVIVSLEFTFNKIKLCVQRSKHSKLVYGSTYNCYVESIEDNGIFIQLPNISVVNKVFVSEKELGINIKSKQAMQEAGVEEGKKIALLYQGNDPRSGAKIFKKI